MARLMLGSVVVFVAGAFLMDLIRRDSGYILVSYGTFTFEVGLWFGIISLIIIGIVFSITRKFFSQGWSLFSGGIGWLVESRIKKADRRTHTGLIHFIEGNWREARKDLLRAAKSVDQPLVHYLAAARSAYEMGDSDETHQLLHQAEKVAPQNELAIALSQARILLLDNRYEQCIAILERVRKNAPSHPVVLDLLKQVYTELKDWKALKELLPQLKKGKQYREDELVVIEENIYLAALSVENVDGEKGIHEIDDVWKKIPKPFKQRPLLIEFYAKILLQTGYSEKALTFLQEVLAHYWSADLVFLYGNIPAQNNKQQLLVAERWLRERPGDASLLFTLGRISMRNSLWGKAREYFEKSLVLNENPDVYAALAGLMAQLGEHEKSTELYQKGLLAMTQR